MAASVEELFDARTQLVAWASHDLRTPLASMQAMLEAVEDGLVEPEHYVPELHGRCGALGCSSTTSSSSPGIDAGVLTLDLRRRRLGGVVRSAWVGSRRRRRPAASRSRRRIDADPPVLCAPDKVERVLLNLLTNAIRHTPSDGAVAVVVEPLDGEVRVSVEDTRRRHPPESIKRVFDHFWRGDRSRTGGGRRARPGHRARADPGAGRPHLGREPPEGGARISFTLPRAV